MTTAPEPTAPQPPTDQPPPSLNAQGEPATPAVSPHEAFTAEQIGRMAAPGDGTGEPVATFATLAPDADELVVRLEVTDTGEAWEWSWTAPAIGSSGRQFTALELALQLVPSLADAIDRAHLAGHGANVTVEPAT